MDVDVNGSRTRSQLKALIAVARKRGSGIYTRHAEGFRSSSVVPDSTSARLHQVGNHEYVRVGTGEWSFHLSALLFCVLSPI